MQINGRIEKIIFEKNGWACVSVRADKESFTAVGHISAPAVGAFVKLTGEFCDDPKWGTQFNIQSASVEERKGAGILYYLKSTFVKGCKDVYSEKIYQYFKDDLIRVIHDEPHRLTEVSGIGEARANMIAKSFLENEMYLQLTSFFEGAATEHQIRKITEKYGDRAKNIIRENPYQLIGEIPGFGFLRIDAMALAYGIGRSDPRRVEGAILYVLQMMAEEGHCYCPLSELQSRTEEITGALTTEILSDALNAKIANGELIFVEEKKRIYLRALYQAEQGCAQIIARLLRSEISIGPSEGSIRTAIGQTEKEKGYLLADKQKSAIRMPFKSALSVITGGPGMGKTTIIHAIVRAWGGRSVLMAPTGKAAHRMAETTGMPAYTIQRAFSVTEPDGTFKNTLLIVDEASMLDIRLAYTLLSSVGENCTIVFVGDADQLPPIGPGQFYGELVRSPLIPTVTLDTCFRQDGGGSIAINATRINKGYGTSTYLFDEHFRFIESSKTETSDHVIAEYLNMVKTYGIQEVACLCPIRKERNTGTSSDGLNKRIKNILNPSGTKFAVGDRVMHIKNNYRLRVMNGDCGTVAHIEPYSNDMSVKMDDGNTVLYTEADQPELVLAYAMSVHKSQGSEYKGIVLALNMEHYIMLQRNLLYTAVTRASKDIVIIGEAKAVNSAAKIVKDVKRMTGFGESILNEYYKEKNDEQQIKRHP